MKRQNFLDLTFMLSCDASSIGEAGHTSDHDFMIYIPACFTTDKLLHRISYRVILWRISCPHMLFQRARLPSHPETLTQQ